MKRLLMFGAFVAIVLVGTWLNYAPRPPICADSSALQSATLGVLISAGVESANQARLAELREWAATVEPACVRVQYIDWIDWKAKQRADKDLTRDIESRLPMPPEPTAEDYQRDWGNNISGNDLSGVTSSTIQFSSLCSLSGTPEQNDWTFKNCICVDGTMDCADANVTNAR